MPPGRPARHYNAVCLEILRIFYETGRAYFTKLFTRSAATTWFLFLIVLLPSE